VANLNWTKTDTGYAAESYAVNRTPGKRWVVRFNGETLTPNHISKLADAKEVARTHADMVRDMTLPPDVVLGVNQPDPQGWKGGDFDAGDEDSSDPIPTMVTTESAPSTATATLPVASTASSSSDGSRSAVLTESKAFYRPVPRESLTDQFTRLAIYADIGIARRFLRESA